MAGGLVGVAMAGLDGSQVGRVVGVEERREHIAEDVAVGVIEGVLAGVSLDALGEAGADHCGFCRGVNVRLWLSNVVWPKCLAWVNEISLIYNGVAYDLVFYVRCNRRSFV